MKRDHVYTTKEEGTGLGLATVHQLITELGGEIRLLDPPEGSEFEIDADLVLLAMGFTNPVKEGLLEQLGVQLDARGNVQANTVDYKASASNVFVAGDMRRGQSLVVWAIREGRQAAHSVDKYLMGETALPR